MPYQAAIQRTEPTAFIFLVDQSGSMTDKMNSERTKAQFVADVLNRTLMNLVTRCTKSDGVRDYFHLGVLGYGASGVVNGFRNDLSNLVLNPISSVEANPLRVEDRKKKADDGAGGIVEQSIKFPVWFDAVGNGGTPMCAAITRVAEELAVWCDTHRAGYPPTVLHVTDGESTDGDPEQLADALKQLQTGDGPVLIFNLHVSSVQGDSVSFPSSSQGLPDSFAEKLFQMSSQLPEHLIRFAREKGRAVNSESRGFMFNAEAGDIVDFFDIGTRAAQLR